MSDLDSGSFAGWYVVMSVAGRKYALNCGAVLELVRSEGYEVSWIPMSGAAIRGVLNHRGKVLPIVELRMILGDKTFSEEIGEMREFVEAREADHVGWLNDLQDCARTGRAFQKALDPKLCAFGKWYEALKSNTAARFELTAGNAVLEKIFADFDAPHKRIHGIAETVLELSSAGDIDSAAAKIQEAWDTDLAQMKVLFRQFYEAFADLRTPSVVILTHRGHDLAMYVDRVDVVAYFEDDRFECAPSLTVEDGGLTDHCLRIDGELAMLLRLDSLFESVKPGLIAA